MINCQHLDRDSSTPTSVRGWDFLVVRSVTAVSAASAKVVAVGFMVVHHGKLFLVAFNEKSFHFFGGEDDCGMQRRSLVGANFAVDLT